ncbi:hypothetical protein H257_13269 [Aphanomyces astaci]|uniref:Telomere length regulation protein conserved domain-containing protein n=1 Tax=Aphanomyces astaci TaxID=112090 RepID=W4FWQ2_APHAT|nr:hypothetical protein H257_13269 [Aphanomyces astaci]ETV71371.1 hypothetical protein H257_13269 [Aphanomyces astaci]|eukprot:XP_009839036.1 hypothetical protein H257_13269 [Aphanomyces astaci]
MSTWPSFMAWRGEMSAAEASYDIERVILLLDLDATFLASCYEDILSHVLAAVAPAWFTSAQLAHSQASNPVLAAVDALLNVKTALRLAAHHPHPIRTFFLALTACQSTWDDVSCRLAGRALVGFLGAAGTSALFTELLRTASNEAAIDVVITLVGAVPVKMHNLLHHDTPSCFTPSTYYSNLIQGFLHALDSIPTSDKQPILVRGFLVKVSRQGHMSTFVQEWLSRPSHSHDDDRSLAKAIPSICYPSFIPSVLSHLNTATPAIAPTWLQVLVPHPVCQYELTKLVLHTPLHVPTHAMLVRLLWSSDASSFDHVFHSVVLAWATRDNSVTETNRSVSIGRFLTAGLLHVLQATTSTSKSYLDQHGWTAYLCKGIQEHMGHALMEVRHTGMRVATALSHILSPESPLVFDDLPPDDEEAKDNDNVIVSCIKTTGGIDGGKLNLADKSLNHVNEIEQVTIDENLDALVQSDSDDESGGGDSVVSLDAYEDLSDNDDDDKGNQVVSSSDAEMIIDQVLQNRAPLVYLWQVKEGLVMEDNRDVTEVALASLPRVIARQPHDLHHMAGEITTVLLRLDDSFQTLHFEALRRQSLVGLCVHVPDVVTPLLCDYIYDNQRLFQTKLAILSAIGDAATAIPSSRSILPPSRPTWMNSGGQSFWPAQFFFPLLNPLQAKLMLHATRPQTRLLKPQASPSWGEDTGQRHVLDDLLMAHVLHTLARVLEATGKNSPHVVSMGKRFLELLWSQRSHALPSVRRQVFFGLSRVMLVLPSFVWQEEVDRLNLGPHLVPFLQYHKDMDPDGGCRTAANLLLTTISQG